MAKKEQTVAVVTIADLCERYNLDGRKVRSAIRSLGFHAPATGEEGFGPKAKYEWPEDDKNLKKIVAHLQTIAAEPKKEAAKKKSKK